MSSKTDAASLSLAVVQVTKFGDLAVKLFPDQPADGSVYLSCGSLLGRLSYSTLWETFNLQPIYVVDSERVRYKYLY
jgi:hypothetical protein